MKINLKSLALVVTTLFTFSAFTQNEEDFVRQSIELTEPVCIYYAKDYPVGQSVQRPAAVIDRMERNQNPCATINVSYSGFTPQAQAAFQFAVDIWAASIESPVDINMSATFSALAPGVLGSAGPTSLTTSNAPEAVPSTFYSIALVEKLEGTNNNGFSSDIVANFSNQINWYYGLDANPPPSQFDFVTVVLHELGHGLGFVGIAGTDGINGFIRQPLPSIYDRFIENGAAEELLDTNVFADPSTDLHNALTGNDLFCNGPIATGQNSGVKPRIYAPGTFNGASSYSHWNESTFLPGNPNSLMTPFLNNGEGNHNPGPITLGFFEDMGWSICGGSLSVDEVSLNEIEIAPNPFTSRIDIKLANGFNDTYALTLYDINGRVIRSESMDATSEGLTIEGLEELGSALYFLEIRNSNNGASITKKVLKQ